MKQFILDRHTVPGTTSLEQVPTDKIPVYETKTAAENDLANLEVGQIIATKDEGNELSNPVDVVQDGNMHAVTSNAVADSLSYFTDEVKTGGKWIDGKPIYRKTLVFTNLTLTRDSVIHIGYIDIPIVNIVRTEALFLCSAVAVVPCSKYSAVYVTHVGEIYACQNISNTITGWNIYCTIEYTKTTD